MALLAFCHCNKIAVSIQAHKEKCFIEVSAVEAKMQAAWCRLWLELLAYVVNVFRKKASYLT